VPLTEKGQSILKNLEKEYGTKKAEQVLYAGKNKGTFTSIDEQKAFDVDGYMDSVRKGTYRG